MCCLKNTIFFVCAFLLLLVTPASAEEVQTKFFTLDLPDDWEQPRSPQSLADGEGVVVIFQNKKDQTGITITASTDSDSAKDIATRTIENLKASGLAPGDPVEKDGIYEITYTTPNNNGTCATYIASNGTEFVITAIFGAPSLDTGKELLKNLKPVDSTLFPKF